MPHFKHDCMDADCCRYAGSLDGKDIYQSKSGDVIIRFGDDGPDYSCYPTEFAVMVAKRDPHVKAAVELIAEKVRR